MQWRYILPGKKNVATVYDSYKRPYIYIYIKNRIFKLKSEI